MRNPGLARKECFVPLRKSFTIWSIGFPIRQDAQDSPLKSLQPMEQHRPVDLVEDVPPDFDDEIGPYTYDPLVVGGVMQLAHR